MRALRRLAAGGVALLLASCAGSGGSGISSYMRGRLATQLRCSPAEVDVRAHDLMAGNEIWQIRCGEATYSCSRIVATYVADITCIKNTESSSATESATARVDASKSPPPSVEGPGATEIRAALDREREGILACVAQRLVGIKAQTQSDRALDIHLHGDLSGSPQEACVRHLLAQLRVSTAEPGTLVIHTVR